jgi:hypothetical protein
MRQILILAWAMSLLLACGDDGGADDAVDGGTLPDGGAPSDGGAGDTIPDPDGALEDATTNTDAADASDDGADTDAGLPPECGNDVREPGEFCDGTDLGGASCASAGLGGGTLACRLDCSGYDISACGGDCTPACDGRECGGDPICGDSCGTCADSEVCGDDGLCETPVVCGDGTRAGIEVCDGADLAGATCVSQGFESGSLGCVADCSRYSLGGCVGGDPDPVCGNGDQESGELCDLTDVSGRSCEDFGFDRGLVVCNADCGSFNLSGCSDLPTAVCGNAVRETGEICDRTDLGGQTCTGLGFTGGTLACASGCESFNTSGCTSACTPTCGTRECGPDPTCGIACGSCRSGEECNGSGTCVATGPRGPTIITFNTNAADITQGESVVFSAVVTDPDGIDDLIGGNLLDSVSGRSYGAFATSAAEGAYSLTLRWDDMHRLSPINFSAAVGRTFRAEFFDTSGNRTTRDVTITLTCDGIGACNAVCTDLTTRDNCGTCGNFCGVDGTCSAGVCACPAPEDAVCGAFCEDLDDSLNCGACGNNCGGLDCLPGRICGCPDGEAACGEACQNTLFMSTCGTACGVCTGQQYCNGFGCSGGAVEGTVRMSPQGLTDEPVLQVYIGGGWQNVCDDGFDAAEGRVACRSLGGTFVRFETGVFSSDFAYAVGDYTCTGTESSLAACGNSGFFNAGMASRCGGFGNSVRLWCSFGASTCVPPSDVLINEVFFNPPGDDGASNSEFVELKGTPGASLTDLRLVGYDAAGNEYGSWPLGTLTVPADGYIVVGPSFNTRNVDVITGGLMQNGPASLQLVSSCRNTVLDAVAYGTFGAGQVARGEDGPASVPLNETSIGRNPTSADSDRNMDNFSAQVLPSPGQANFLSTAWFGISLAGDFGGGDRTYNRTGNSCGSLQGGTNYIYDVYELRNFSGLARTIDIEVTWLDVDGYIAVYNGDVFNPANAVTGCTAVNDDATTLERGRSLLTNVVWGNGGTITLVLTGYEQLDYGAYTINLLP